jgi:uncharacterized protein involved in outer membrane biogenesis
LNLEFLNALDLDLIVSIDEVEGNRLRINSIKGKLELEDGRLAMPMDLVFDAGSIETNLNIALMTVPTFGLSILADDISLGPVMSQFSDDVPIQGYSNLQLDLQTRGSTAHEMASNLSGSASLGLENVRLRAHYIEALSLDVFGWAVSKSKGKDSYYNLNCVVLTFGVDSGEVRSEDIIADGPKMSIGGQINLNLAEETLDIVLIPKQKKRVFSSPSPVKIHGEILDPKVHVIPVKAAMYQIGAYSLGSRIYIPVRAFENLWSLLSDGDKTGGGCENIDKLRKAN